MAIMAITTKSSIRVKDERLLSTTMRYLAGFGI
jgi:hypothetical protein